MTDTKELAAIALRHCEELGGLGLSPADMLYISWLISYQLESVYAYNGLNKANNKE